MGIQKKGGRNFDGKPRRACFQRQEEQLGGDASPQRGGCIEERWEGGTRKL